MHLRGSAVRIYAKRADSFVLTKGVPMYGPQRVLKASTAPVALAATGASTGFNSPLFYAAGVLFVGGLVAMVVSKLVAVKG
jgi:hypothetical protein